MLLKYIIQASTPKLPKSIQDKITEKGQHEQDQKRNKSMRQKKDRRSHSFRERAFTSPDAKSMGSVTSESPMKAAPQSVMRSLRKDSKGPHGIMTILSEDFSNCSTANSNSINKGSNEKRTLFQSIDKKTFTNQDETASMATSNSSKTTTYSDSQDILVHFIWDDHWTQKLL